MRWTPPLLLLVVGLLVPGLALALSCVIITPPGSYDLLPADGAEDVPSDALMWSIHRAESEGGSCPEPFPLFLFDADGAELELVPELELCGTRSGAVAMRPSEPLVPGTLYRLAINPAPDSQASHFRVVDATDDEPPPVPRLVARSLHADARELRGPCPEALDDEVVYSLDSEGDLNLGLRDGGAEPGDPETVELADMSATDSLDLPGRFQPATRLEMRFGAYDLSGNFSGWSEPDVSHMPAAGCTAAESFDEAGLALLLLLVGGGLVRRRG